MLRVASFTFNPFQENTYLIINEAKQCWIVDPGMNGADEDKVLFSYIEENELIPQAIINTHAHIDHIFGVQSIKAKYNIPFGLHEDDTPVLNNAKGTAMLFGFTFPQIPLPDFLIKEGSFSIGEDTLEVRLAPGHSPGSIVFYSESSKFVIAGDVLFQGSIGRTDLPGGNHNTLLESIRNQMYSLPDNTMVYPGHGAITTIGIEKRTNPFVQE